MSYKRGLHGGGSWVKKIILQCLLRKPVASTVERGCRAPGCNNQGWGVDILRRIRSAAAPGWSAATLEISASARRIR